VAFLGYQDSGMMGTPENDDPASFWQAPVDEAAERLADLLREESADLLTIYDSDGVYGHPDHIQVHRVGVRAAALAGTPRVAEATFNRDHIRRMREAAAEAGLQVGEGDVVDVTEEAGFGRPDAAITTCVDVSAFVDAKRASMAAHASQIAEGSFFLSMPDEAFLAAFGQEWYVRHDREPGPPWDDDLLEGL
jgi:LmbE family N-acetylglucosaminyl deacetylase